MINPNYQSDKYSQGNSLKVRISVGKAHFVKKNIYSVTQACEAKLCCKAMNQAEFSDSFI